MLPINRSSERSALESWAFGVLCATLFLAPLVFWPSQDLSIETVKTAVISVGTLVSVLLYAILVWKEKRVALPPRSITWTGLALAISIVASAAYSGYFMKSFFGQGFELNSGAFLIVLLLSGAAAFIAVYRNQHRALIAYAAAVVPFLILFVVQALRLVFGPGFLSMGVFGGSVTSSMLGGWFALASYAVIICIASLSAIQFLNISGRTRLWYWIITAAAGLTAFIVNDYRTWAAAAVVFLGMAIFVSAGKPRPEGGAVRAFFKRLSWLPLAAFAVSAVLAVYGTNIAGPVVSKVNAGYSELSLPWQMTLDVFSGAIKSSPLLGVGPNRFLQAFLLNKPAGINPTNYWGVEFNSSFGLIPTFGVTQGLVGLIIWTVFFIFIGILGARSLKRLPENPVTRFITVSSFTASVFLWLMTVISVPPHALLLLAFVMTGIWLGTASAYGGLRPLTFGAAQPTLAPAASNGRSASFLTLASVVAAAAAAGLLFFSVKDAAALAYFGAGVGRLTASPADPVSADSDFSKALALSPSDAYWRARTEAALAEANVAASFISSAGSTASTSQAAASEAVSDIGLAASYADSAIAMDPTDYYNYLSKARAASIASGLKIKNGYQAASSAYTAAIALNPGNPSLYVSLAGLQASNNDLDKAIQTLGAALQVKNNYIDAVFLLSQVEAAKGNLPDAITAARFAISLNPQNALLYFQLGLLEYDNKDYQASAVALEDAVKISPDYANAEYFLGLAYARLDRTADAASIFERLAASNPDNADVAGILAALRAGKSPFSPASPAAAAAAADKRQSPPIPDKPIR